MSNHRKTRAYSQSAKRYNLICLGLITLGSIGFVLATTVLGAYGRAVSTGAETVSTVALAR
jgi:hypothetical protein